MKQIGLVGFGSAGSGIHAALITKPV